MKKEKNLIRKHRKLMHMTQRDLALISGIAGPDINVIEKGKRPIFPSWRTRISIALKLSESELFGG